MSCDIVLLAASLLTQPGPRHDEVLVRDMSVCPHSHLVAARFFMTPFLHIDTGPRKEWRPFGKQVPGHDGGLLRDCCCTEVR